MCGNRWDGVKDPCTKSLDALSEGRFRSRYGIADTWANRLLYLSSIRYSATFYADLT
jgi:hypothetical protein